MKTLMKSNLHLWMPMKRLALSATIQKPWPHTARSRTCPPHHHPHPLPPNLCPSAHPPPPWHYFLAALASGYFHYCVLWPRTPAGSPFIQPLAGDFQSQPSTPPCPRDTHTDSHTHTLKAMSARILIFSYTDISLFVPQEFKNVAPITIIHK